MGLTKSSCSKAASAEFKVIKNSPEDKIISIAGNPNVGKSTIFNALTGMKQHTGNWAGKTVGSAQGYFKKGENSYVLVDIPGTYSLNPHSPEEEIARDFIAFGGAEACVVVCDATCLERNLSLVLSITEITGNVAVCVNLLDEAKRKGINVDLNALSQKLGVRVVGTVARNKKSLTALTDAISAVCKDEKSGLELIDYPMPIGEAVDILAPALELKLKGRLNARWLALRILSNEKELIKKAESFLGEAILQDNEIIKAIEAAKEKLEAYGIDSAAFGYAVAASTVATAERICRDAVTKAPERRNADRKADKLLTGRAFGYPVMLALLLLILWITITGANYISEILSDLFELVERGLRWILLQTDLPQWIERVIIDGAFKVPAIIVSVMLPPMAIFFPLFTLLEDVGYLPRVAFNLDRPLKRCNGCGKQALTMCMGLGCNAAGVVGCRIIDSPRERMLAILTNSFIPCNGRLPQHKSNKVKKRHINTLTTGIDVPL